MLDTHDAEIHGNVMLAALDDTTSAEVLIAGLIYAVDALIREADTEEEQAELRDDAVSFLRELEVDDAEDQ